MGALVCGMLFVGRAVPNRSSPFQKGPMDRICNEISAFDLKGQQQRGWIQRRGDAIYLMHKNDTHEC